MKEHKYVDRSKWYPGNWDNEPDRREWRDETTGYPCLIRRGSLGAWCGYVAVPPGHPMHGKDYNDCPVEVHGGLTFAEFCSPSEDETAICHTPEPGEPDNVFWFGFDCAHWRDLAPGQLAFHREMNIEALPTLGETYRTLDYVVRETEALAAQLKALETY